MIGGAEFNPLCKLGPACPGQVGVTVHFCTKREINNRFAVQVRRAQRGGFKGQSD